MQHSLLNNIKYVYKESFNKYPRVKWFLLINFITELLVPLFTVLITTLLVYFLTSGVEITKYVLFIVGFSFATYFLETLRYWSYLRYTFENTFTRNSNFLIRLANHQVTTDYINIETIKRRKTISQAFEAISGNYHGIEMLLKQTPLFFINLVGLVIYGVLIAIYVPYILGILFIMTIVNYFLTKRANNFLAKMKHNLNDEFNEKYYLSKDTTNPNYGKDIRLYNLGKWFDKLFVNLTKNRRNVIGNIEKKFLFANLSNTIFLFIRDFLGYGILLGLVINRQIDLATFTFLIGIVAGFSMWLNGFTQAFNYLRSSNVSVNNYRECLAVESGFNKKCISKNNLTYPLTIEFKNVTFAYPDAEEPTINNLSFIIKPGEKIALVGSNGAGKTTISKLLCGLYKPDDGVISVNNYDINRFNIDEYMSFLSVVFQDSEPLSLTIENIIACSKSDDINQDMMWEAIRKSGLKEKIMSLNNKEKTYITQVFDESGIRPSGGEIQKLMLARSLYKNAPILILDEPTAALDPIAEEKLYIQYKELVEGCTSIFISHRLSSTKFCDRIFYLDEGCITEEGSHRELMKLNKQYREIFDIQAKYYKEGVECE
ncbi:ABC transporter ATP-binding protein [Candidatus Lokiarchaeum ossiferum]|uniref:ABC transporter ATP-binding protein n=1 Tax=Candidatus Lokiarchaeum ossiferum TaxID=2951803 RepID=UPI00352FC1FA